MKNRNFVISLVVVLALGIFAVAGIAQAAEVDQAYSAMKDGAKQMMDANKKIMDIMSKKGMKDAELTAAEKQMADGYDMILKAQGMLGSNKAEAQSMVSKGGKMMLEAQKKTAAQVEKKGMVNECKIDLSDCSMAEKKMDSAALDWFFGGY